MAPGMSLFSHTVELVIYGYGTTQEGPCQRPIEAEKVGPGHGRTVWLIVARGHFARRVHQS